MASEPCSPSTQHPPNKSARDTGPPRPLPLSKAISLTTRKAESEHDLPALKKMMALRQEPARGSLPVLETIKRVDSLNHSSKSSSPTNSVHFGELLDSVVGSSESNALSTDKNKVPKYHKLLGEMGKTLSEGEFPGDHHRAAFMCSDVHTDMPKLPTHDTEQRGAEFFQKIAELDAMFGTLGYVGPGGSTTGSARHHKYAINADSDLRPTRDQLTLAQDADNIQSWLTFENAVSKT